MELRGQIRGKYNRKVKCVSSEVGLSLDPSSATWPSENYCTYPFRELVSLFVKLRQ